MNDSSTENHFRGIRGFAIVDNIDGFVDCCRYCSLAVSYRNGEFETGVLYYSDLLELYLCHTKLPHQQRPNYHTKMSCRIQLNVSLLIFLVPVWHNMSTVYSETCRHTRDVLTIGDHSRFMSSINHLPRGCFTGILEITGKECATVTAFIWKYQPHVHKP